MLGMYRIETGIPFWATFRDNETGQGFDEIDKILSQWMGRKGKTKSDGQCVPTSTIKIRRCKIGEVRGSEIIEV